MIHASIPPGELGRLIHEGVPDYRPVYVAMRSAGVGLLIVRQGHARFPVPALPGGRGIVAVIGDDTDRADGPHGFHRKSLRRLAGAMHGVVILSCGILPDVYASAAATAVLGRSGMIIETRPEREAEWLAFVQAHAPTASLLFCTCAEGTA